MLLLEDRFNEIKKEIESQIKHDVIFIKSEGNVMWVREIQSGIQWAVFEVTIGDDSCLMIIQEGASFPETSYFKWVYETQSGIQWAVK